MPWEYRQVISGFYAIDEAAKFSFENGISKTCQKFDMTKDAVYMARVRLKKKMAISEIK